MQKAFIGLLAVLGLAGCSGSTRGVGVSARVGEAAPPGQLAQGHVLSAGIQLKRVRLVVRVRDLERERGGKEDVEAGPLLVDLKDGALEGGVVQLTEVEVPAGRYSKVRLEVHPLRGSEGEGDEGLAGMRAEDASVIIGGTIDGRPFSFISSLGEEQEYETIFDVGEGSPNLTLNLDVAGWFVARDGSRLDPRDPRNRSPIEDNIKRSIDAYCDDDRDGHEDAPH